MCVSGRADAVEGVVTFSFHLFSIPEIHQGGYRTCQIQQAQHRKSHYNKKQHYNDNTKKSQIKFTQDAFCSECTIHEYIHSVHRQKLSNNPQVLI